MDFNEGIMDAQITKAAKQISSEREDLLFEWFKPYGITRENVMEYIPRILINEVPTGFGNIKHFFLDCNYIFSVEEIWIMETGLDGSWHGNVKWNKFIREKEFDPEQEDVK